MQGPLGDFYVKKTARLEPSPVMKSTAARQSYRSVEGIQVKKKKQKSLAKLQTAVKNPGENSLSNLGDIVVAASLQVSPKWHQALIL